MPNTYLRGRTNIPPTYQAQREKRLVSQAPRRREARQSRRGRGVPLAAAVRRQALGLVLTQQAQPRIPTPQPWLARERTPGTRLLEARRPRRLATPRAMRSPKTLPWRTVTTTNDPRFAFVGPQPPARTNRRLKRRHTRPLRHQSSRAPATVPTLSERKGRRLPRFGHQAWESPPSRVRAPPGTIKKKVSVLCTGNQCRRNVLGGKGPYR